MPNDREIFRNYLIQEFLEDYQELHLTRREALRRIAFVTGSFVMATNLIAACTPAPPPPPSPTATAAPPPSPTATTAPTPADPKVAANDPDIQAQRVEFPGQGATLIGYLAHPRGNGPFPAILVCHENRGLTEHIQDVTRRLAKAGYAGLAVDLLSRQGSTDKVTDAAQVPGLLGNTDPQQFVQDFQAGWTYLKEQSYVRNDRVGMVGFCFGGGVTWRVAAGMPEMRAAVPFYGPHPMAEAVPGINAAVLAMYGETDTRINAGIPAIEEAMKAQNKTYEKMIYPGAGHAFHNDTGQNYKADAARDAWTRTLAWFDRYVKA